MDSSRRGDREEVMRSEGVEESAREAGVGSVPIMVGVGMEEGAGGGLEEGGRRNGVGGGDESGEVALGIGVGSDENGGEEEDGEEGMQEEEEEEEGDEEEAGASDAGSLASLQHSSEVQLRPWKPLGSLLLPQEE